MYKNQAQNKIYWSHNCVDRAIELCYYYGMQNKRDPRGRKPIGDKPFDYQVAVRLGPAEVDKLAKFREDTGLSTAAIIRMAIVNLDDSKIGEYWPDDKDQESEKD